MSGPPAMIEAGHQRFLAAGLPEERLYYDSFEYAPGRAGADHRRTRRHPRPLVAPAVAAGDAAAYLLPLATGSCAACQASTPPPSV